MKNRTDPFMEQLMEDADREALAEINARLSRPGLENAVYPGRPVERLPGGTRHVAPVPLASGGILGIDPGLGGGLALMDAAGHVERVWDMPTVKSKKSGRREYDLGGCWDLAREAAPAVLALEHLQPMPGFRPKAGRSEAKAGAGRGAIANFAMGRATAIWEMVAIGQGLSLERVRPQRWQTIMDSASGEKASLARARELWPQAELRLEKHAGRAAALLIAEAVRRIRSGAVLA